MKVIAFVNNKGGVGKTLASQLLAEYLAMVKGKKVLAIDFDPQCNFSSRYLQMEVDPAAKEGLIPPIHPDYDPNDEEDSDWDGRSSIADIFYGEGIIPYPTFVKNLDMAPGHADRLLSAESVRKDEVVEKVHNQLSRFLNVPDVKDSYDAVIIDTAPSKGPLTVSVIKAASHIIIPSVMEPRPIQGIYGMMQLWMQEDARRKDARSLNGYDKLKLIGILPNKFKKQTTLHTQLLESLVNDKALAKYMLPVKICERILFAEVDSPDATPKSIFDHSNSNKAHTEALDACEYISKEIFKNG